MPTVGSDNACSEDFHRGPNAPFHEPLDRAWQHNDVPLKSSKYTSVTRAASRLACLKVVRSIFLSGFQPGSLITIEAPLGWNWSASKTAMRLVASVDGSFLLVVVAEIGTKKQASAQARPDGPPPIIATFRSSTPPALLWVLWKRTDLVRSAFTMDAVVVWIWNADTTDRNNTIAVANVASRLLVVIMVDDLIDQLIVSHYIRVCDSNQVFVFLCAFGMNPIGIRIERTARHFCHRGVI